MIAPTPIQIKEIAEQLACGFCCYYHKISGEIVSIPDFEDRMDDIEEFYGEDLAKIKKDKKNFIIINKPSARESFEIMENFIEEVNDTKLKNELINALNKKKPFSHFKLIIETSIYKQNWFAFKEKQLQQHVLEQISFNN
ncbi:MAG: hypothetical protein EOO47_23535 [Flavobacterium sp.]|nr:MAG: hypothetical protein EOO47_23535 [Flavobacterium sp.]